MVLPESFVCPRCGAPLPTSKTGSVTCRYCRAKVSLEQRVPRHGFGAGGLARLFWGPSKWVRLELAFALIALLGAGLWFVLRRSTALPPEGDSVLTTLPQPGPSSDEVNTAAPATAAPEIAPHLARVYGKLLLSPANEQPPSQVLLVARFDGAPSERELLLLDADNGRQLWSWSLPDGELSDVGERAWSGDSILVRTSGSMTRLDASSGKVVWSVPFTEPGGRLCVTEAYVAVRRSKPPRTALDWNTGRRLDVKGRPCEFPPSTHDAGPNFDYVDGRSVGRLPRGGPGFSALRALVPRQGNARVLLGLTTVGPPTPRVGVVAGGAWVWQQNVSASLLAVLPQPPLAAVRRESVVVPYWDTQNGALRFSAFRLAAGEHLWDAALVENTEVVPDVDLDLAVSLDGTVLVRLFDGRLNAYSLQSGKLLWSVGG